MYSTNDVAIEIWQRVKKNSPEALSLFPEFEMKAVGKPIWIVRSHFNFTTAIHNTCDGYALCVNIYGSWDDSGEKRLEPIAWLNSYQHDENTFRNLLRVGGEFMLQGQKWWNEHFEDLQQTGYRIYSERTGELVTENINDAVHNLYCYGYKVMNLRTQSICFWDKVTNKWFVRTKEGKQRDITQDLVGEIFAFLANAQPLDVTKHYIGVSAWQQRKEG